MQLIFAWKDCYISITALSHYKSILEQKLKSPDISMTEQETTEQAEYIEDIMHCDRIINIIKLSIKSEYQDFGWPDGLGPMPE